MTATRPHRSALPHPGPEARVETCVRALALPHPLLLSLLLQLLALLARHHPALAARVLVARLQAILPSRHAPRTAGQHESWGIAADPAARDASGEIALAIARLMYVFGPRPRRGMRALPNTCPRPRRTPPIRPPPRHARSRVPHPPQPSGSPAARP